VKEQQLRLLSDSQTRKRVFDSGVTRGLSQV